MRFEGVVGIVITSFQCINDQVLVVSIRSMKLVILGLVIILPISFFFHFLLFPPQVSVSRD